MKKWFVTFTSAALIGFGGMSAAHADHEEGTVNCDAFSTGEEVWEFWESHDYSSENDPEGLDGDSDGVPCESLTVADGLEQRFLDYDEDATTEAVEENGNGENENNGNNEEAAEENENNNNDHNDADNNANNNDNNHDDEGNEMPATATSYPTLALMALLAAGAGGMMLMRRRTTATE